MLETKAIIRTIGLEKPHVPERTTWVIEEEVYKMERQTKNFREYTVRIWTKENEETIKTAKYSTNLSIAINICLPKKPYETFIHNDWNKDASDA